MTPVRLLVYVEPTSYLLPLCRQIVARSTTHVRVLFLERDISQPWKLDLAGDQDIEVLQGSRLGKLRRLAALLSSGEIELVDVAGWGHPLLMATLVMAGACRIPVAVESDTQWTPGTVAWRRGLKRAVLPLLFCIPRLFLPAGTRQAAYFRRYGVLSSRITIAQMTVDVAVIRAQVDRERALRSSPNRPGESIRFLYVGRLEPHKGVDDMLHAFALLVSAHPTAKLVVVGDGSLRGAVESAAHSTPGVTYLGRLGGSEVFRAYSDADVFLIPSRREPWGLVVNEAMAAGLPVIATDRVGCADDLVRHGRNGWVVPAEDAACLAQAMGRFLQVPGLIKSMGQASREIIAHWTIEDEVRILLGAWETVNSHTLVNV